VLPSCICHQAVGILAVGIAMTSRMKVAKNATGTMVYMPSLLKASLAQLRVTSGEKWNNTGRCEHGITQRVIDLHKKIRGTVRLENLQITGNMPVIGEIGFWISINQNISSVLSYVRT
jgi:hypothetical protein